MNKDIGLCIVLTIITCGIYGIYWIYTLNEAACYINPSECSTSGGLVILLGIITCGIYWYYWFYKMGKAMTVVPGASDNSLLYLILHLFGLDIVSMCILQSDVNRAYPV